MILCIDLRLYSFVFCISTSFNRADFKGTSGIKFDHNSKSGMLGKAVLGRARLNFIAISGGAVIAGKFKSNERLTLCSGLSTAPAASNIVLYEYKICPFCNKVKAYLDFLELDYKSIEVNPLTKSQIKFQKEFNKVPLAVFDGTVIGDSVDIITKIKEITEKVDVVIKKPDSNFYAADTQEWSEWADKKLAVMLYPNITRTMGESWECFGYIDNVESWSYPTRISAKVLGTAAMSLANGKIKTKYGIVDERLELKQCLLTWTDALKGKDFLHGDSITMPDILVFGVLRAIEGLQTFTFIMEENQGLKAWYDRVKVKIPHKQI
jgi:microsomal prostaglandin-E synthase 2